MNPSFTIWTNYLFPNQAAVELAIRGMGHRVITSSNMQATNLSAGTADPTLRDADILLGQPDPNDLLDAPRLKWVHLTSAGYDRYDRADLRDVFTQRGAILTTSSGVYDEPCAQHVFAMMLSLSRQLPQAQDSQRSYRGWPLRQLRKDSYLLAGQTVVIFSYGAIAKRLIEMLRPFGMKIYAVRRKVSGDETVETITDKDLPRILPQADHVVNILPGGEETRHAIDAGRFAQMKQGVVFYNIGRGTTVDQDALLAALQANHLRFAYLDVTDPEPLPPAHPLWMQSNCLITPHTAGGSSDEFERLVRHFMKNLGRFQKGEPMSNRVI